MSEQGRLQTPEEMTRGRIANYRDAAAGWLDVHTYSYEGEVQRECFTSPGEQVVERLHEAFSGGFDAKANPVTLVYDGVMSPKRCTELADGLEAQLQATN